jgi:hypothetical protein
MIANLVQVMFLQLQMQPFHGPTNTKGYTSLSTTKAMYVAMCSHKRSNLVVSTSW